MGRLAIGVRLGVHGARHGSHTGDVVIQSAGEVVHKPAAVGIPHGVNAGEVHTVECVHLVNQGRHKIDVAVRIRDCERQITARDDLPIGGAAIVGVRQRLRINEDKAILVSGIAQIPDR